MHDQGQARNAIYNADVGVSGTKQDPVFVSHYRMVKNIKEITCDIAIRQHNFLDRVIGPRPCNDKAQIPPAPPVGLAQEMESELRQVRDLVATILERMGEIENIA